MVTKTSTILEAIQISQHHHCRRFERKLQQREGRLLNDKQAHDDDNDGSVDILGIVVDLSFMYNSHYPSSSIWIQDQSIVEDVNGDGLFSLSMMVYVSYRGRRMLDLIQSEQKIMPGDVVRFNRVQLFARDDDKDCTAMKRLCDGRYDNDMSMTRKRPNERSGSRVYGFRHPWMVDHEADMGFYRLGHVDVTGRFVGGGGGVDARIRIPGSMETNPRCISELVEWYRGSNSFSMRRGHRGLFLGAFGQDGRNQENIRAPPSASLSPPPCQIRSLSSLQMQQSSVGLSCTVVAFVQEIDSDDDRKRDGINDDAHQSRSTNVTTRSNTGTSIFICLLTDGKSCCMAFVDDNSGGGDGPNRSVQHNSRALRNAMHEAHKTGQPVKLSHVMTTPVHRTSFWLCRHTAAPRRRNAQRSSRGGQNWGTRSRQRSSNRPRIVVSDLDSDDVILIPTKMTTATLATTSEVFISGDCDCDANEEDNEGSEEQDSHSPEKATRYPLSSKLFPKSMKTTSTVHHSSPILDIMVDNTISIRQKLLPFLLHRDHHRDRDPARQQLVEQVRSVLACESSSSTTAEQHYRSVHLTLRPLLQQDEDEKTTKITSQVERSCPPPPLIVMAGGDIVRTLCGDVGIHEWSTITNIGEIVCRLLAGLIRDEVELHWTLLLQQSKEDRMSVRNNKNTTPYSNKTSLVGGPLEPILTTSDGGGLFSVVRVILPCLQT